jgi:hypothetical protein
LKEKAKLIAIIYIIICPNELNQFAIGAVICKMPAISHSGGTIKISVITGLITGHGFLIDIRYYFD